MRMYVFSLCEDYTILSISYVLKMLKDIAHRTTSYIVYCQLDKREQRIYDGGYDDSLTADE